MSITSSNNLSVSNSLTVSGNSILGSSSTATLICNAIALFVNGLSTSGNISQSSSGTITSGSGDINLNGNVIINGVKTLTTSKGTTTFNALVKFNENMYMLTGKSIFISESGYTSFLRLTHVNNVSYIYFTGGLNFMNGASSSINTFNISSTNNQATFNYDLNTNGLSNLGTISSIGDIRISDGYSLYTTDSGLTKYIRIHNSTIKTESIIDYKGGFVFRNLGTTTSLLISSSTNLATSNYNLNTTEITNSSTNPIINNGILTQNSTANINSDLNVTGSTHLSSTGSFPIGSTGGTQEIVFFGIKKVLKWVKVVL